MSFKILISYAVVSIFLIVAAFHLGELRGRSDGVEGSFMYSLLVADAFERGDTARAKGCNLLRLRIAMQEVEELHHQPLRWLVIRDSSGVSSANLLIARRILAENPMHLPTIQDFNRAFGLPENKPIEQ